MLIVCTIPLRIVQKIVASILLFAFLGQTFNQEWYYLGYLLQKKEYMKQCVNKARPQMHCNGKCLLMKKIEEQEKKEQGQPPALKFASRVEVLPAKSSFLLSFNFSVQNIHAQFFPWNSGIPVDQPSSIFHPPPANC